MWPAGMVYHVKASEEVQEIRLTGPRLHVRLNTAMATLKKHEVKKEQTLQSLKANAKNPRKEWSSDEKKAAFVKSLSEFGDLSGIVWNSRTKQLVGGHKRIEEFKSDDAAKIEYTNKLETADVSGTTAYGYVMLTSGVRFAYREVNWDKKKEMAANLAANQWAAEWDWEGVSDMLKELNDGEFDLSLTGFDHSEFEPLLAAEWDPPAAGDMPVNTPSEDQEGTNIAKGMKQLVISDAAHDALQRYKEEGKYPDYSAAILALVPVAPKKVTPPRRGV